MEWVLPVIIVAAASLIQSSTGFGFSIMAVPFLMMVYGPREAIQLNIILSLFISAVIAPSIWRDVDKPLLLKLIYGSLVGMPLGIAIFIYTNVDALKVVIGLMILIITILILLRLRFKTSPRNDLITGVLSGLLTTGMGMPGPPLLVYFSGSETDKDRTRSTTLAFFIVVYTASLIMQIIFNGTSTTIWKSTLILAPVVGLGMFLGQYMYKWINQRIFSIIMYTILIFTGAYLTVTNLFL